MRLLYMRCTHTRIRSNNFISIDCKLITPTGNCQCLYQFIFQRTTAVIKLDANSGIDRSMRAQAPHSSPSRQHNLLFLLWWAMGVDGLCGYYDGVKVWRNLKQAKQPDRCDG